MVYACNPSYLGGRVRRITVPGHSRQKGSETLSQRTVKGALIKSMRHYLKNN
jgi:hypothetical protein